jgi:opacity protein-like surface antigen
MNSARRALSGGLVAAAALGFTCCAQAQSDPLASGSSRPGKSFLDINVGRARYDTPCGVPGLTCQNNVTSYSVTAGNMFTENFGAELSYLNFGTARRADGGVTARGLNLSVVGRVPLGQYFGLSGKVGTTYGITHVNAPEGAGVPTGKAKGFGLGYGVGLDVRVAHNLRGEIGWEQHDFHFAGSGTSNVRNVTLGVNYTF